MKKKILSLVLSVVLVLGMVCVSVEAEVGQPITIYLTISDNGEFVTSPITGEKMSKVPVEISYFDLADYDFERFYRYEANSFEEGGAYKNTTIVETPTLLHLFIKSMETYYLGETFDAVEHAEFMSFSGEATSAYATKFWAHDSNMTYLVNHSTIEMCEGFGASCDYILLEDGMEIDISMFSTYDWCSSGNVSSFDDAEMTSYRGGKLNFEVKGYPIFFGGDGEAVRLGSDRVSVVKSSQLDWKNDLSKEIITETNADGLFEVEFDALGDYYIIAVDKNISGALPSAATVAPSVCKVTVVEPEALPEFDGDWTSFRGNQANMGVVNVITPQTKEKTRVKWAEKLTTGWDSLTAPIIVNENLYLARNNKVLCISADNGCILAESGELSGTVGYGTTSIIYGDGMFFVPISDGRIQALRADNLESVWLSESMGGQLITPITYKDGKLYCGTYVGETESGKYFCISTEDENTNEKTETKECLWEISHAAGFYWAGAYVTDCYAIFGSDDGLSEGVNGTSVLYSINPETGAVIDTIEDEFGDIRSTVAYDSITDRVYFTTKGGLFCSVRVNSDGTFDEASLEKFNLGGASTVTPLVYDGLAYIGVAGSAQFGETGHGYKVIDVTSSPMREAASVAVPGYSQSSALLSTGYADSGNMMYVYLTYNNLPGGIYVLKSQKSADNSVTLSAADLFVPEGEMAQFCICSPICDSDGVIYYKNDSGYLIALEKYEKRPVVDFGGGGSTGDTSTKKEEEVEEKGEETADNKEDTNDTEKNEPVIKETSFDDVKGHWAEEYIAELSMLGIIKGKADNEFAPEDNITRAEFVTLLYRISNDTAESAEVFEDVKLDEWYSDAVNWAVNCGIAAGTSEKEFSPDEKITREQAVTFISRYLEYKNVNVQTTENAGFADSDKISDWAKTAVLKVMGLNIIEGKGENLFAPSDFTTRAETAKILVKMMDVIE